MSYSLHLLFPLLALASLTGLAPGVRAQEAPAQDEGGIVVREVVIRQERDEKDADDDDDKHQAGRASYWLGVACELPSDEVRARLHLPEKSGLVIQEVIPGSPAAKAGLKPGDVIVGVGEARVSQMEGLAKAVTTSEGRELKLGVIREGKTMVIAARPEKREEGNREAALADEDRARLEAQQKELETARQRLEEQIRKSRDESRTPRPVPPTPAGSAFPAAPAGGMALGGARGSQPARVWTYVGPGQEQLPDDMQVTISKRGNKPAVVVATQGEKSWKTTENELEMLPPAARAYAAGALGKRGAAAATGSAPRAWMMMGEAGQTAEPQKRQIELRLDKQGNVLPGAGSLPEGARVMKLPGGGLQVELRDAGAEKPIQQRVEMNRYRVEPRAGEPGSDVRVEQLLDEVEKLRGELNRLRSALPGKDAK